MPDLIAISQGLNAVKAATEIVKTIAGLRDSANLLENTVGLNQKILSVQTALADAQSEQASLIQRIGELEKEVTALKSWEAEKQRYELKRYDSGSLFYTLKEAEARGEPVHHLCAKCYNNGKPSIIQRTGSVMAREPSHFCPECKTQFHVHRTANSAAAQL
jgi:Zn finger protein HypA/HybF involved in hydrogenase expression